MPFTEKHIISTTAQGEHRVAYSDWGDANARPIMCVHGLTGNGFDFDFLAESLIQDGYRLICIDLAGRGRSDFLRDPMDYNYDQYIKDIRAVLIAENLKRVDWLGVSLGGLLGIYLAGGENSPIDRMIINDVGPTVSKLALDFIHKVIAQDYWFEDVDALEVRMRATRGLTWGPVTDAQWAHMAEHNARAIEGGGVTYAYDPRIADMFEKEPIGAVDLWAYWDRTTCPILVLQGKKSMILTKKILKMMRKRVKKYGAPDFDLEVFKGCGHVPSLMAENQIDVVRDWLNKQS